MPWSDEQIWKAVDDWRWVPPAARRETTNEFDLAVTPGSFSLTYAYGFSAREGDHAEQALDRLRERVLKLGGTGVRLQTTPRSQPSDLTDRLLRRGYHLLEEAEALVWELTDEGGRPRIPAFDAPEGIATREVLRDDEYAKFLGLQSAIFGDPEPPRESLLKFQEEFHQDVQSKGHSDRFLAWDGEVPVGRAGMEVVQRVARFWGTGVLPHYRRRGVYGALVAGRCREALRRGAEIGLVTARVGTSGPILKRHGFRCIGSIRVFEARWSPGISSR